MVSSKSRLRVGSADDVDIVIKQATVSRYHCEFRWVGGAWELHDLDSTNGTFVDGKKVTTPVRISSSALITLGRGVPLAIPAPPNAGPSNSGPATVLETRHQVASNLPATANVRESNSNPALIYVLATAVGMLMLGGIAFLIFQLGRQDALKAEPIVASATPTSSAPKESDSSTRSEVTSVVAPSNASNSVPKVSNAEKKNEPAPIKVVRQSDPAIWAVLVESADGKERRLIGSAVAVGPNRLVTLASIVDAFEACKTLYPKIVLSRTDSSKELVPSQFTKAPKYLTAISNWDSLSKRLAENSKRLAEKMKSNTESELLANEGAAEEEMANWAKQIEAVKSEAAKCDLASIAINETLDKYYPVGKPNLPQSSSCLLRGIPLSDPCPTVTNELADYYFDLPAMIKIDARSKEMIAETSDSLLLPVVSMVCLNSKLEVIGLCSLEEPVKELPAPRRCIVSQVEVFWE